MINGFMMKYVDFVADVVQPYSQFVISALKGQQCIAQGNALGRLKWSIRPVGAKASLHISDETKDGPGNATNGGRPF